MKERWGGASKKAFAAITGGGLKAAKRVASNMGRMQERLGGHHMLEDGGSDQQLKSVGRQCQW